MKCASHLHELLLGDASGSGFIGTLLSDVLRYVLFFVLSLSLSSQKGAGPDDPSGVFWTL